jgi:hypothetical protein
MKWLRSKNTKAEAVVKPILKFFANIKNIPVGEAHKNTNCQYGACRWISNDIKTKELIAINVPAYQLTYFRNGVQLNLML